VAQLPELTTVQRDKAISQNPAPQVIPNLCARQEDCGCHAKAEGPSHVTRLLIGEVPRTVRINAHELLPAPRHAY